MEKSKIQGELWGKAPKGWAEIQEIMHKPLWNAMLDITEVESDTNFLDVGCGAGGASIIANERGANIYGIDVAQGLLNYAIQRIPKGKFQVADIENLPYEDNKFDVIFASNSLQYSENRIATLHELKRVCKPDGRIVAGLFGSPEKVEYRIIFKALRDAMPEPPKGGGPFELSMDGVLEGLFTESGMTNITTGEVNCPFEYSDFEMFWEANVSAGPLQGMLKVLGEGDLRSAMMEAVDGFLLDDGRIVIQNNIFKFVSAVT
jgi:SAM-dependent methyltransferase